ncbi:MAG: hypothetical protein LBG70_00395 [Bifidobacteriaceae bacterium]|jgi:hypothetical protein|nr:hypothetical protein [Bifidobacteriaceae bacterium]
MKMFKNQRLIYLWALLVTLLGWLVTAVTPVFADSGLAVTEDSDGDIVIGLTIPERTGSQVTAGGRLELTNARLDWGFNLETRGKSYFGDCNFLMAGRPGDNGNSGAAKQWGLDDWGKNLYHSQVENTAVVNNAGVPVSFDQRCLDSSGQMVRYNPANQSASTYTETRVQMVGGTGWLDKQTGEAAIDWPGMFTVVYYDGLSYFWLEAISLTVAANGAAELTATAAGYGMPREGGSWDRYPNSRVVLASAPKSTSSDATEGAFTSPNALILKHAYQNRAITVPPGSAAQQLGANSSTPGAWHQSFVNFQAVTGLSSYWYSSGAAIDHRKPPDPLYISWDANDPVSQQTPTVNPSTPSLNGGWQGGASQSENPTTSSAATTTKTVATASATATIDEAAPNAQVQPAGQGEAGVATANASLWPSANAQVAVKTTKNLVPQRLTAADTMIAAPAAIFTLLATGTFALIAWRRGWFRFQPEGIVSP